MKRFLGIALVAIAAAVCFEPSTAQAQASLYQEATALRASAVLTASDVYSTFTLPGGVKAVHFYVDFTKGSLTSASFAPGGAVDGNPAFSGYYRVAGLSQSLTADGRIHMRVPREDFGAHRYAAIVCTGVGTVTSSLASVKYKLEY